MESYLNAEISESAIRSNLAELRKRLPGGTKLCSVVKADCYGHGLSTLLGLMEELSDVLAVATPEEAIRLRHLGYERPILMFFSACAYADGPELRDALDELIAQNVTLTVVNEREVESVAQAAQRVGATAHVHVKIDSGMNRSGVLPEAAADLARRLRETPRIQLEGFYTHYATADEADKEYVHEQLGRFLAAVEACGGPSGLTLHAANSAATIDLPQTHLDMVRPGIALYGYQPSDWMTNRLPLRPALRLTGRLMQVKHVPAGSRCGYGLTHTFDRPTRLGLVPVGYGDGYLRCLSNQAMMKVRGRHVPVRGKVSMDQVIIDLTEVPQAQVGDEVEIFSNDPAAPNSVENLARLAGTIPYELTCRLGRRVRRTLVP